MTPLEQIAHALAQLHEDAFSPLRSATPAPIDQDDRLTRATAHPHLRPAGAADPSIPHGDAGAARLYRRAVRTITDAYDQLVPPQARQRPRSAMDGLPGPVVLTGMLAMLQRTIDQWDRQPGTRAADFRPVLRDQVHQLDRLAHTIAGWWTLHRPEHRCTNPRGRDRCQRTPVVAHGMCKSCVNHEHYLAAKQQTEAVVTACIESHRPVVSEPAADGVLAPTHPGGRSHVPSYSCDLRCLTSGHDG